MLFHHHGELQQALWQEGIGFRMQGIVSAVRGKTTRAAEMFQRAIAVHEKLGELQSVGVTASFLAQLAIWADDFPTARQEVDRASTGAQLRKHTLDIVRANRLRGLVAVHEKDYAAAEELLQRALKEARSASLIEEELVALMNLSELHRRCLKAEAGRACLDEIWTLADRGPFRLVLADARNVLAGIYLDVGDSASAEREAREAYRLAWCDGPPFAYHWGLTEAQRLLSAIGSSEPRPTDFVPPA
jgi:tetratricopeptide (TPR) repeat protein